jgi:ABC-type maltose transport system permease subunit
VRISVAPGFEERGTYAAIILAHTALVLPLAVWRMTGYLQAIPSEIEEAAMVDGCSRLGAVVRVLLPISLAGVAATAMVAFVSAWGEFLFAFVLLSGDTKRLMSVAVFLFLPSGQTPTTWGLLFAAAGHLHGAEPAAVPRAPALDRERNDGRVAAGRVVARSACRCRPSHLAKVAAHPARADG